MEKKPLIFKASLDVHFADLDMYNHVNSKHYVDYVSTSRLLFMEKKFNISLADLAEKGIGFYLKKSEIEYLRPISGLIRLDISSYVQEIINQKLFIIPFSIKDEKSQKEFSRGILHFSVVNLKNQPELELAHFIEHLFYESDAL